MAAFGEAFDTVPDNTIRTVAGTARTGMSGAGVESDRPQWEGCVQGQPPALDACRTGTHRFGCR
jgi:hypothetical protein